MMVALWLFMDRTLLGRALRATAVNRLGARLVGIRPGRAGVAAFALTALIGALSGVLIGPITPIYYDSGFLIALKGFIGAVVGGLVGFPMTVVGAILVGLSAPGMAFDKYGNVGTHLDLWLLGPGHLYKKDAGFDPEGLLGTLPAIVNVLGGYLAGLAVQRGADLARTTRRMALCGLALVGAGLAWSPWFPIAKKLWTGSYVLLTLGIDCLALAAIIAVVELAGRREGTRFFLILGRNPLAIYLFSELFVTVLNLIPTPEGGVYDWVGKALFQSLAPGAVGSLLCALAYTMVCWAVGWAMDRKGLILRA